jgi:hypothetical protein
MDYSSLRKQPTEKLRDVNKVVEDLLSHSGVLPTDLSIKLGTFHADLAAILEDLGDIGDAGST